MGSNGSSSHSLSFDLSSPLKIFSLIVFTMRILTIPFFIFLLSYRLNVADDGAGPSSARPNTVNPGTEPHHPALSPVVVRFAAIQKQLEGIETELSILRATVRDPQITDAI